MWRRLFCIFIVASLLVGMLTLAYNIQSIKTELSKKDVSGRSAIMQEQTALTDQDAPPTEWSNTYGGYSDEFAFSVDEAEDGGYVVAGSTKSYGVGIDAWLFKTYPNGTMQWQKNYGGLGYDYASYVQQTGEGGYIIAGATNSFSSDGSFDIWLIKTDSFGTMQWTNTISTDGIEEANSIQQTADGGYIIAGSYRFANPPTWSNFWLVKTNSTGGMEWQLPWGGNGSDVAYSAIETRDGGFIAAGSTMNYYAVDEGTMTFGSTDAVLVKTDSGGNIEWNKTYGRSDTVEQFAHVQQTFDGQYIVAGYTNSSGTGSFDFWLLKIGADGSVIWDQSFGGLDDDYGYSVQATSDDGYVIAGSTYSTGDSSPDFLVVKTGANGNKEWEQVFSTPDTDEAQSIHETRDGGFVVLGYTYYSGNGVSTDAWLVKIKGDTDGDGLRDSWERKGIDYNRDGVIDFLLPDADWKHKDLYVEVDYMTGHDFDDIAKNSVITAFKNSPVKNPDNINGINLHVEIDEQITHQTPVKIWDDYDTIKASHFGSVDQRGSAYSAEILSAKKLVYRYCLFIHNQAEFNSASSAWETKTYSGISEFPGNDFVVSLGSFTNGKGSTDEQAGTFMHELGHTLALDHGGGDEVNYKPNYLSVMSYAFQFPDQNPLRPLDYSRVQLPDLDEAHLKESAGIGAEVTGEMLFTVYSNATNQTVLSAGFLPVDWNGNGHATDENVVANINNYPVWDAESPPNETLRGYDDWNHLNYSFQDYDNFPDFAHGERPRSLLTWETVQAMREAVSLTHDVAVLNVEPAQPFIVPGSTLPINVTVMNQGGNNETFLVTVYANANSIASQELTLERGNITTIDLIGETASFSAGDYTLSAYATPVANETDVADNTYSYGQITITSNSAGWMEWGRSYPTTEREWAYSVCESTDGGFAIAGATGSGYNAFLLVKIDPTGNEEWRRTFSCGQYCDQIAYSVEETLDSGYILAGYLHEPSSPYWLWLVKTDSEGNMLWNRTYVSDFGGSEYQWVARQTGDGGYVAAGTRWWDENDTERYEMWLIRTDSEGNELWNKTYTSTENWAVAYSVWQTSDGGYVVGGYESSPESEFGAALLIKTDPLGNEEWNKTYSAARIFSVQQTADEGYVIGGSVYFYGQNDYSDAWMLKTDAGGNTLWNRTYTCAQWSELGNEEAYSVRQISDGGYVLAGYADQVVDQLSIRYVWVAKMDADGNMQTDLVYGSENTRESVAYSVQQTSDGSYIAAGYVKQPRDDDPSDTDLLLLKFNFLIVIPEFTPNLIVSILLVSTLAIAVFSRRRRTARASAATMH